jgi:hypothetical protein
VVSGSGDSPNEVQPPSLVAGAIVHTDGWRGYDGLEARGYTHRKTVIATSNDPAHVVTPAVHRVASLLKRWILGTHQGSVTPEHLLGYLEEFSAVFSIIMEHLYAVQASSKSSSP